MRSQIQLIMMSKYLKHQLVAEEKRASVKGMCWCSVLEKSNELLLGLQKLPTSKLCLTTVFLLLLA